MKRCTYCGKEYPEDVTICSLDQNPVTLEGKAPPLPKPPRFDNREHLASRPFTVKLGVGLLAFDLALDMVLLAFKYGARIRDTNPAIVFSFAFSAVIIYLVFRGKNWARWLVGCLIIVSYLSSPFVRHGPPNWDSYFSPFVNLVAVVALFQRSANDWYRRTKRVPPPVPAELAS